MIHNAQIRNNDNVTVPQSRQASQALSQNSPIHRDLHFHLYRDKDNAKHKLPVLATKYLATSALLSNVYVLNGELQTP